MKNPDNSDLLLSLCCSLLGEIPSNLRAAAIQPDSKLVSIYFYFDGEISEDDADEIDSSTAEINSGDAMQKVIIQRIDFPDPLPDIGLFAFSRDTLMPKKVSRRETIRYPIEVQAILSICQAMFGKVTPKLRAAGSTKTDDGLDVFFFMNQGAEENDLALIQKASQEVISDFPEIKVRVSIKTIAHPNELPHLGRYAFIKKEAPVLQASWKYYFFLTLCEKIRIPVWMRAIAFQAENLVSLRSKNSITLIHFFYNGHVSEDELVTFMQDIKNSGIEEFLRTAAIDFICKRIDFPSPLPNLGIYTFSRDTIVPQSFEVSEMIQNHFEFPGRICTAQALFGRISPNLRNVVAVELNQQLELWFTLDHSESTEDLALTRKIANDILCEFPRAKIHIDHIPFPDKIPQTSYSIFSRKE